MIARIAGKLVAKELDRVEIFTSGGVAYELAIPLGVYETLPRVGEQVELQTHLVVREDAFLLFGFATVNEKRVFQRLLTANGVGPSLALGLLSTLSAERLVRAIREKDIATLQGVPRVGKKKAERLVLDLSDKLDDVAGASIRVGPARGGCERRGRHSSAGVAGLRDRRCREGRALGARHGSRQAVRAGAHPRGAREDRRALSRPFAACRARLR